MRLQFFAVLPLAALIFGCSSSQAGPNGGQPPAGSGGAGSGGSLGAGGVAPATGGPGRVTLRRLNAREYDNTIRDLVGLDLKPSVSEQFPADEWGDGFDNDGDVLTTSALASEKY